MEVRRAQLTPSAPNLARTISAINAHKCSAFRSLIEFRGLDHSAFGSHKNPHRIRSASFISQGLRQRSNMGARVFSFFVPIKTSRLIANHSRISAPLFVIGVSGQGTIQGIRGGGGGVCKLILADAYVLSGAAGVLSKQEKHLGCVRETIWRNVHYNGNVQYNVRAFRHTVLQEQRTLMGSCMYRSPVDISGGGASSRIPSLIIVPSGSFARSSTNGFLRQCHADVEHMPIWNR